MSEWLKTLFVSIFGSHSGIATFVISMIPIVELRGAIPFGAASSFWGENALPIWQSFLIALAGSSLVCVILTFLFWPLFNWLKKTKGFKKFATWIEGKLNRNAKGINDKTEQEKSEKRILRLKLIGVFLFVAVPIPLTGVWTGTCLALFIGLNKKQTLCSVLTGNVCAGLIMLLVSYLFKDNTLIVLYAFLILFALIVIYEVIKSLIVRGKKKKLEKASEGDKLETEAK
ncbi:MAG: small multi-drug export protein [Clostridia bacterium]|nr:small multi-drug export protein [Clostridia bacterium]